MIKILVDNYPERKSDCPFFSCGKDVCRLKKEPYGNEFGCGWLPKNCDGFDYDGKFNKEKCGMLKDIKEGE